MISSKSGYLALLPLLGVALCTGQFWHWTFAYIVEKSMDGKACYRI